MEAAVATTFNVQFVMSGNQLEMRPLAPAGGAASVLPSDRFPTLREMEQEYIQRVMTHVGGNRSQAARMLGIDRVSLWRKLKQVDESVCTVNS